MSFTCSFFICCLSLLCCHKCLYDPSTNLQSSFVDVSSMVFAHFDETFDCLESKSNFLQLTPCIANIKSMRGRSSLIQVERRVLNMVLQSTCTFWPPSRFIHWARTKLITFLNHGLCTLCSIFRFGSLT